MGGNQASGRRHTISQLWDMERKLGISSFVEARASELDLQVFNQGGYVEAVREKAMGKVSQKYHPNDETESGKELIGSAVFFRSLFHSGYDLTVPKNS